MVLVYEKWYGSDSDLASHSTLCILIARMCPRFSAVLIAMRNIRIII